VMDEWEDPRDYLAVVTKRETCASLENQAAVDQPTTSYFCVRSISDYVAIAVNSIRMFMQ
jgi:hypothetical protein